jgi:hypothetical protein
MEEWHFICHQDCRWTWEMYDSGRLTQRSLGSFSSKEHCTKDAREHGYSWLFCRRAIKRLDGLRVGSDWVSDERRVRGAMTPRDEIGA